MYYSNSIMIFLDYLYNTTDWDIDKSNEVGEHLNFHGVVLDIKANNRMYFN